MIMSTSVVDPGMRWIHNKFADCIRILTNYQRAKEKVRYFIGSGFRIMDPEIGSERNIHGSTTLLSKNLKNMFLS
jgi:hypothetical protein